MPVRTIILLCLFSLASIKALESLRGTPPPARADAIDELIPTATARPASPPWNYTSARSGQATENSASIGSAASLTRSRAIKRRTSARHEDDGLADARAAAGALDAKSSPADPAPSKSAKPRIQREHGDARVASTTGEGQEAPPAFVNNAGPSAAKQAATTHTLANQSKAPNREPRQRSATDRLPRPVRPAGLAQPPATRGVGSQGVPGQAGDVPARKAGMASSPRPATHPATSKTHGAPFAASGTRQRAAAADARRGRPLTRPNAAEQSRIAAASPTATHRNAAPDHSSRTLASKNGPRTASGARGVKASRLSAVDRRERRRPPIAPKIVEPPVQVAPPAVAPYGGSRSRVASVSDRQRAVSILVDGASDVVQPGDRVKVVAIHTTRSSVKAAGYTWTVLERAEVASVRALVPPNPRDPQARSVTLIVGTEKVSILEKTRDDWRPRLEIHKR